MQPSLDTTAIDAGSTGGRRAFLQVRELFRRNPKNRTLHLTWLAFFISFVLWFNFAPFTATIGKQFGLSKGQLLTLGLCNIALTVPARIFIGMALDRFGPRRTYSTILVFAAFPCLAFAWASSFQMMVVSRLLLSVVGAGFVVGIRMVSEWFPPKELGTAEGLYGGWGNFGAAAAAGVLPLIAGFFGPEGWRWAMTITAIISFGYGVVYSRVVQDTPDGVTYAKPKRQGALEVTSRGAVLGLLAITVPIWSVLVVIAWRILDAGVIGSAGFATAVAITAGVLVWQLITVVRVNRPALNREYPADDQYPFRSVAVLCMAYFCTFGAELAVVTMLPQFFDDTWKLGAVLAGLCGSSAAYLNLVSRPAGGLFSDLLGNRRRTLRVILVGFSVGYLLMSLMGPSWPVLGAVAISTFASLFGQAGNGAIYAIVPLVKKRVSGQVAGMAGAYGNIGGVIFLALLGPLGPKWFFVIIGSCGVVALIATRWLVEPARSFSAELLTDETVIDAREQPRLAGTGTASPSGVVIPIPAAVPVPGA